MKIIRYFHDYTNPAGGGILRDQQDDGITMGHTYTWPHKANVILGGVAWATPAKPYALLLTPAEWRIDGSASTGRERLNVTIYYLMPQSQLDFDASANEVIIDQCISAAADLLDRVRHDRRMTLEDATIKTMSVYNVDDRNLTGVRVILSIKDNQGYCLTNHHPQC